MLLQAINENDLDNTHTHRQKTSTKQCVMVMQGKKSVAYVKKMEEVNANSRLCGSISIRSI